MADESSSTLRIITSSILEDYNVFWNQKLGTGISGPVRPCVRKQTNERFALKCLNDKPKARLEVKLHAQCNGHPNVVTIYHVYANDVQFPGESHPKPRLLVVMEMMDGGELFDRISKHRHFTESLAASYTAQIASAIQKCHYQNIAHRDIKPENLLLKDNTEDAVVKLSDFGFAKVDDGSLMTPHFTPYYVAPQILEAQKHQARERMHIINMNEHYTYDKSCDMWSLGVIVYIMLCGYPPFYSETPSKQITRNMKRKIMAGDYEFPEEDWAHISHDGRDLVRSLLDVDPSQRLTVDELLKHPWLERSPSTPLDSPTLLLDKNALEEAKLAHSLQLTHMRVPDKKIVLKPMRDVNNPIIRKRQHIRENFVDNKNLEESGPPKKQSSADMAVLKLRDIVAHCILPPKDEGDYEDVLNQLILRAVQANTGNSMLCQTLNIWGWDGGKFQNKVDRNKLASAIGKVIKQLSA